MFDFSTIVVALITSITTIASIYLKDYLTNKSKRQKLTVEKSYCYIELDKICAKIRDDVKADAVYIAYFHNGGTFINGVDMDKYTVIGEDYNCNIISYKKHFVNVLVNNFPYVFHNLIVRNKYYCNDINEHSNEDKCYKEELRIRSMKSAYSFLIKDPIKNTPIGFISIEYHITNGFNSDKEMDVLRRHNEIANLLNQKY